MGLDMLTSLLGLSKDDLSVMGQLGEIMGSLPERLDRIETAIQRLKESIDNGRTDSKGE